MIFVHACNNQVYLNKPLEKVTLLFDFSETTVTLKTG